MVSETQNSEKIRGVGYNSAQQLIFTNV